MSREALSSLFQELTVYVRKIDAPANLIPLAAENNEYDCLWVEADNQVLRYMYRERDNVDILIESTNPDLVLEHIFSDITQGMATRYEAEHRIAGQDSRRQWFKIQESLMRCIRPDWADHLVEQQNQILLHSPFADDFSFQQTN